MLIIREKCLISGINVLGRGLIRLKAMSIELKMVADNHVGLFALEHA